MTGEVYKIILTDMRCPKCQGQYKENNFVIGSSDPDGYKLKNRSINYSLSGKCRFCQTTTNLRQLGVPQLTTMEEVENYLRELQNRSSVQVESGDEVIRDGNL